jgi:Ca-activated chloride channel family protein
MTARPEWFALLLAVPLWLLMARRSGARRRRAWARLGREGRPPGDGLGARLGAALLVVAALVGPVWIWGWGSAPEVVEGHDVVLVVDVSRSMAAEDAVPDRLGAAVAAARTLLTSLGVRPTDRAGLVAFAGRPVVRCPLTENLGVVNDLLSQLRPGEIEPGGSDLARALERALDVFDDQGNPAGRSLIVFSDGEDHEGRWREAIERCRRAGVVVHAVGFGDDRAGAPIPVRRPGLDAADVLRYRGEVVLTRRVDAPLRAIAVANGGVYLPVGTRPADLAALYRERIEPSTRRRRRAEATHDADHGRLLLLGAVALLGLARPFSPGRVQRVLSWGAIALAVPWLAAAAPQDAGLDAYRRGRWDRALDYYQQELRRRPASPILRFNAASALYRLGRFDEAADAYRTASAGADPGLRMKIDYALGNTLAALGQFEKAIAAYDACIASPLAVPPHEAIREDARINRQFVLDQLRAQASAPEASDEDHEPSRPRATDSTPPPGLGEGTPPAENPGNPPDVPPTPGETPPGAGSATSGGGGQDSSATPPAGTPREQFESALRDLEQARRNRLSDQGERPGTDEDRRDW